MAANDQHEPVAIVGMGCRWPGGVRNAPQLWEFLRDRQNGWREFDGPRFSTKGFHHPNSDRPGTMSMKGAFLADEDARLFDHTFFGMTGLEVETMDPSQRKLLEVTYEALENGGETWESVSGSRTGVFVGNFCLDHWMIQSRDWDNPRPYAFTGAGTSILANRISYIFNLQGPSLTVDTACSSSMYALHLAVNAIRAGDCDSAIVASANWIADPGVQIALDKLGALSASSRCHTFDTKADGYARGEGFAALYIKKSSLAVLDGSPIRAVIRGSAINSNGRTGGITRPSAAGQEAVIREAYRNAGDLPFSDTSYFECHGTGTYVGDPIEVAAVGRVFAPLRSESDPMLVGSVKSNVGHSEGASALASIMKVVLSLEKGNIPPIFNLETLNPNIDFEAAKVKPVRDLMDWPEGRLHRASINSFGYGGANGHCIIDHVHNVYPDYVKAGVYQKKANGAVSNGNSFTHGHQNGHSNGYQNGQNGTHNAHSNGSQNGQPEIHHHPVVEPLKMSRKADAATRQLVLLPFSAHNESSLRLNLDNLSRVIDQFSLADLAFTFGVKRSRLPHRSFRIVDRDNLIEGLEVERKPQRSPLQPSNIGFIFTGQGAQWPAMGAQLFDYRVFRTAITHLDDVLGTLPTPPSWRLSNILSDDSDSELVQRADVSQTACTAVQIGLVDLLASWSVIPSAVAGHSSGEMAAAYASGRITAAEAIVAAYYRGQAVSKNQQTGLMLAVGLGAEQVSEYLVDLEDQVKIAAINSPGSVTLSGEVPEIESLSTVLTEAGIFNRTLKTGSNAYHSHHMIPLGRDYSDMLLRGLAHIEKLGLTDKQPRYKRIPWVSSVTPSKNPPELNAVEAAMYWRANLESPVRFSEAVTNLVNLEEHPIHAFVEIGPHPSLKSPIDQILKTSGKTIAYASTLKRQQDSRESVLTLAGTLFCLNADINLAAVNAVDSAHGAGLEHGCTVVDLPPYQYTYGGLNFHESRASKEYRFRDVVRHDLLGSKVAGNAKLRPQWRNILRTKDLPWLVDHRLLPDAVFPAAGYVAMAIEAASRVYDEFSQPRKITGYLLRDVAITSSLQVPEDDYGVEVMTSMELLDNATAASPAWATFSISSVARESNEWTEHCTGIVKVDISTADPDFSKMKLAETGSRAADARGWYKKFAAIGLGYGSTFQPLSEIRADPDRNIVTANLALNTTTGIVKDGESRYSLHPASLDGMIQLGLIACHEGQVDKATTAFVPVQVPSLYISSGIEQDSAHAIAHGERRGLRGAYLDLQLLDQSGEVVVNVEGLRCVSYSSAPKSPETAFSSPFTRLVWKPDIRSLTNRRARGMFPPPAENVERSPLWGIMNKMAYMVVYNIYETFGKSGDSLNPSGDVGHFFSWIKRRGLVDDSPAMEEARKLSSQERVQMIEDLHSQAPDVIEVRIAKLLHDNMADILHERRTGVDVIIQEGLLTPLYEKGLLMTGVYPQLFNMLDSLGHANPNARILEIGGGTGGATRVAMKAFKGPNGIKSYSEYTFTDISPGFLSSAREALSDIRDMNYSVLDVEVDPLDQGYEHASYDVIIACQVLHATSSMIRTLKHVRNLLKPGGKLVLVETTQNFMVPGVVVGTFTGYWNGIPDRRVDAPFMSLSSWDSALREAGFSGAELVLDDFPDPHNTTSVILASVVDSQDTITKIDPPLGESNDASADVQLLHSAEVGPRLMAQLSHEIKRQGLRVQSGGLDGSIETLAPGSNVVVFLDEKHLLSNADERELMAFQSLARNAVTMIILTSCGIAKGRNPDGALIPGLLRVLGTENPAGRFISIDIDSDNFDVQGEEADELIRTITSHELALRRGVSNSHATSDESSFRDVEFVWQDGCMWVSRIVPDGGSHAGSDAAALHTELLPVGSQGAVRAAFETPGVVSSLYFTPYKELWQPLSPDHIDVQVVAVGLNSQDLNVWSGRADGNHLSSEYAGIVAAKGAQVSGFEIGDRVYGLGKGQFGNVTRVPAALAIKMQPGDDLVQMATMPLVYMTAIYVLDHVVRLRKGHSILVQSASSDVGLAAIRLAQAKGAEVFVMVDTPDQGTLLVAKFGIPLSHILSSHLLSNLRRAAALTPKGGFDVILSTAQDELLSESVRALAPLGYFVDLGRLDGQKVKSIGSEIFQKNAHFSTVDSMVLLERDSALVRELMQMVDKYYRQGLIGPIHPFTATDVGQLSQALTEISKGGPVGKQVVTFASAEAEVRMTPPIPTARFDPEASYVITGGLSGLGQSVARWMGDRGARHFVLLSRRSIDSLPEAQKLVDSFAGRGIEVRSAVCDVSDREQVFDVVKDVSASRPIKGIVHAAVSYLDLSFDKLSLDRWQQGLAAKVQGTKNLHDATLDLPLDFFVMTTTAVSVYALATQAAYTAANNFQDMFARYRRRQGLPASTVSFSLIQDAGKPGQDAITVDTFERQKALTLSEHQFLGLLEPAFLNNVTSIQAESAASSEQWFGKRQDPLSAANLMTCLDPARMMAKRREELEAGVSSSALPPRWYSDGRVSLIMRAFSDAQRLAMSSEAQNPADTSSKSTVARLRRDFDTAIAAGASERGETVSFVQKAITNTVAEMLFIDVEGVDAGKSVAEHGVDSLIAAELRNWFVQALGTNISMLNILDPNTSIRSLAGKIVDDTLAAKNS